MARAIFRRAYLQYPHFRIGLFAQSSTLGNTENSHLRGKNEVISLLLEYLMKKKEGAKTSRPLYLFNTPNNCFK